MSASTLTGDLLYLLVHGARMADCSELPVLQDESQKLQLVHPKLLFCLWCQYLLDRGQPCRTGPQPVKGICLVGVLAAALEVLRERSDQRVESV